MNSSAPATDLREYFAAERTLLAYIRTGLSMMGIGFVVARFSLMLRMFPINPGQPIHPPTGHSLWLGTALVLLGSAVTLLSAYQYEQHVKNINRAKGYSISVSWLAVSLSLTLGFVGVAMAVYLVSSTG